MKHRFISLALCVLLLALCLPVQAADTGYSGPLDPETGEPAGQGGQDTDGRTALSASMYYDWYAHDFAYPIGDTLGEGTSGRLTSPLISVEKAAILSDL